MLCRGLTALTETLNNFGAAKPRFGPLNFKTATAFTFVPSGVESVAALFNPNLIFASAFWAYEVMREFVSGCHNNFLLDKKCYVV